jgi:hypothetical protein
VKASHKITTKNITLITVINEPKEETLFQTEKQSG